MADDMRSRRKQAARYFTDRRGELDLTQEEVAALAGVGLRTVQGFEAGRWPNPSTRASLERAVGWPSGEIARLASPPRPNIDPQLLDRVRQLSYEDRKWMIDWLRQLLDEGPPRAKASPEA